MFFTMMQKLPRYIAEYWNNNILKWATTLQKLIKKIQ